MKKRYILISIIFIIFIILNLNNKIYATDLDEIVNYVVTVNPRMNDSTLDIEYNITWKVLDSTTEGPLEWVTIGTPNSNFDTPTAITSNIKSITQYNGAYVKIVFNKKYYAGEQVTFKYSIHQSSMCKKSFGNCIYKFTPAWFTDAKVDNMTIKWNSDKVKSSDSKQKQESYLIWNKTDMAKGEKMTISVKYNKSSFATIKSYSNSEWTDGNIIAVFIFIIIIIIIMSSFGGGGYYGHRGFYGGYGPRYYGGGCAHSSCACAHSSCASSCACACAGSGRAGCSKKDFYGTKLTTEKIKKVFKD